MANRTGTCMVEPGSRLCIVCRIADGHRHAPTEDHHHADGIACACGCHDEQSTRVIIDTQHSDRLLLVSQFINTARRDRGPPAIRLN